MPVLWARRIYGTDERVSDQQMFAQEY
jgi:hypothetical protein